jgi:Domain of unknown function (DUF4189)
MHLRHRKWFAAAAVLFGFAAAAMAQAPAPVRAPGGEIDPATGREYNCEIQLGLQACDTLGMLTGPAKPKTPRTDAWGAVALAPSNLDWGDSWNYRTRQEAETEALSQCKNYRGAKDCKIVMDVPGYCVSLAISGAEKKWAVSGVTGASDVADPDALFHCNAKSCGTVASFCADNVRHLYVMPAPVAAQSKAAPAVKPAPPAAPVRR